MHEGHIRHEYARCIAFFFKTTDLLVLFKYARLDILSRRYFLGDVQQCKKTVRSISSTGQPEERLREDARRRLTGVVSAARIPKHLRCRTKALIERMCALSPHNRPSAIDLCRELSSWLIEDFRPTAKELLSKFGVKEMAQNEATPTAADEHTNVTHARLF